MAFPHSFIHSVSRYLSSTHCEPCLALLWGGSCFIMLLSPRVGRRAFGRGTCFGGREHPCVELESCCPTLKFMGQDGYGDRGQLMG